MNLDEYRSTHIGIVFQSYNLLSYLTALENVTLAMDISKEKITDKKDKDLQLMQKVELVESYANRKILKLSREEQQRIAIARSLSYDAKMIVADKPTGNLNKDTENDIMKIFKNLARNDNKCIIIVTHSDDVCKYVDTVYELKKQK